MAKHPGGRPTDYKPDYARMAKIAIEKSGFSVPSLAKLFNVDRATIYRWMDKHPEFCDAIRDGRKTYEGIKIHRALAKRAVGYTYTETYRELNPITGELEVVKKVRKQQPPDVAAIKHWQVNMDPDNWKDKKHVSGDMVISQAIAELEAEGRPKPEGDSNE